MGCEGRKKNDVSFVKARYMRRSDDDIMKLMAAQQKILAGIEKTRLHRAISEERFAVAAGVGLRTFQRARSGLFLMRASTLAKLRQAQRKAAAGALS